MNSGHLRFVGFGAASGFPVALGFVVTFDADEAIVTTGTIVLFAGLLIFQTRAGILAMRANRGPAIPVARTSALIWAGAVPVFFAVLVAGKWLGAFDDLNRVGPWDWGPHLAVFLTEGLVIESGVTGVIVIAVVAAVRRVRRRPGGGGAPADAVSGS
jgi:hypothetical protein